VIAASTGDAERKSQMAISDVGVAGTMRGIESPRPMSHFGGDALAAGMT
jgi:hypothetical protein